MFVVNWNKQNLKLSHDPSGYITNKDTESTGQVTIGNTNKSISNDYVVRNPMDQRSPLIRNR